MSKPVDRTITFAGAGSVPVGLEGRYIRIYAADPSGVTIQPDSGSPLLRFPGQQIDTGPGGFKRLQVSVTVASTVRIGVSEVPQDDTNTNVTATLSATINPGGTVANPGDVSCANGAATQLYAGGANTLTVGIKSSEANTYAVGTVRIGTTGVTGTSGLEISPGETLWLASTAPIFAYNDSGAAVDLQVLPLSK